MTFDEFRQLISEISHVPMELIQSDASFRNAIGIDSLQMVNLLVELSTRMEISLHSLTDSDSFATPGKLYQSLLGGN